MKLIEFLKQVNEARLDEMVIRYREPNVHNAQVVAYKQFIWIVGDLDKVEPEVAKDIEEKTGSEPKYLHDRPDILTGMLQDDELYVDEKEVGLDPRVSSYIRKVAQFLGVTSVRSEEYSEYGGDYEGQDIELEMHQVGRGVPDIALHGTNTSAIRGILKYGLDPTRGTGNWETGSYGGPPVGKFDINFLTVRYNSALHHAYESARKSGRGAAPIVLVVKIPDKDQIGPDYDVAMAMGINPELADIMGYSGSPAWQTASRWISDQQKLILAKSGQNMWKHAGVFSYRGRIPASFIVGIEADFSGEDFVSTDLYDGKPMYDFGTDFDEFLSALEIYHDIGYWYPGLEDELEEMRREDEEEDEEEDEYAESTIVSQSVPLLEAGLDDVYRAVELSETFRRDPRFEEIEDVWRGGLADFGDPQAARVIQALPGYRDYRNVLVSAVAQNLGDPFTAYRAISPQQLEDWENGADIGPVAVTTSRRMAEGMKNFAGHGRNDLRTIALQVPAEAVIMRGKEEEAELVVDANEISFHTLRLLENRTDGFSGLRTPAAEPVLVEGKKEQYQAMFSGITALLDHLDEKVDAHVRALVNKTIQTLRREDRILWALRIFKKLFLLELKKLSIDMGEEGWPWTKGMEQQLRKLSDIQVSDVPNAVSPILAGTYGGSLSEFEKTELGKRGYKPRVRWIQDKKERNQAYKRNAELVAELYQTNLDEFYYHSYSALESLLSEIGHYIGVGEAHSDIEPNNPVLAYRFSDQSYDKVKRDLSRLAKPLERKYSAGDVAEGEVFLQLSPHWRWELLGRTCRKEAKAMGHCGGLRDVTIGPFDHLLSLREIKPIEGTDRTRSFARLTFVWNSQTGLLSQMRGPANTKPNPAWHPLIVPLLMDPRVKGFSPVNYRPEGNFHLYDLDIETLRSLIERKPQLVNSLPSAEKKAVMDRAGMRGMKMYPFPRPPLWSQQSPPESPLPETGPLGESAKRLNELYTPQVTYLKQYLKSGDVDLDPYHLWSNERSPVDPSMADWLWENYPNLIEPWMEKEGVDDPNDLDEGLAYEIWHELPEEVRNEYTEGAKETYINYLLNHDPSSAPSTVYYSDIQLLKRPTWLVHFSNNAFDISQKGFKYGVDQMDQLGLTTWLGDQAKEYGGYNFAFEAGSREANNAAAEGKYGKDAVMFTNAGVRAWHSGDEEHQVIFWGANVDPRSIIYIARDDDGWCLQKHWRSKSKRGLRDCIFRTENFEDMTGWIEENWRQYAKIIMAW